MLREQFIGRNPTHFQINPIVRAFIISEAFIWSSWNFITPIFAIFVTTNVENGSVEIAASSFSTYLISRVIFELLSGRYLSASKSEVRKFNNAIFGISLVSLSYLGFAFTNSIPFLFIFYAIAGMGLGIATPSKNSLFSTHLDRDKEPTEWGAYDAVVFLAMALATALGGFIAGQYGFRFLFIISSVVNIVGIVPYVLYRRYNPAEEKESV